MGEKVQRRHLYAYDVLEAVLVYVMYTPYVS